MTTTSFVHALGIDGHASRRLHHATGFITREGHTCWKVREGMLNFRSGVLRRNDATVTDIVNRVIEYYDRAATSRAPSICSRLSDDERMLRFSCEDHARLNPAAALLRAGALLPRRRRKTLSSRLAPSAHHVHAGFGNSASRTQTETSLVHEVGTQRRRRASEERTASPTWHFLTSATTGRPSGIVAAVGRWLLHAQVTTPSLCWTTPSVKRL